MRAAFVASILLVITPAGAQPVVQSLTLQNFDQTTSKGRWLINFHAPWCAHCKELAPVYEKVAQHLHADMKSGVRVAKVDAHTEKELAERFKILGYPTIVFLQPDGKYHLHKGKRTFDEIIDFVRRFVPKDDSSKVEEDQASSRLTAASEGALARFRQLGERAREIVTHLSVAQVAWSYWKLGASASGLILVGLASIQYIDARRDE
jgi:protein disulfide-isomerase-like protein